MRITKIEILETRIPFRFTFRHSLAERSEGHGVLVRITDDSDRVGYGECVPRSYVTGETPESVQAALLDHLTPPWLGCEVASFDELAAAIERGLDGLPRNEHAAHCALELALLDLGGRVFDKCAGDLLGPKVNDALEYSGVISADGVDRERHRHPAQHRCATECDAQRSARPAEGEVGPLLCRRRCGFGEVRAPQCAPS